MVSVSSKPFSDTNAGRRSPQPPEPQGIRDINYDPARREFLVVVGRSISGGNAPFQLCTWDGSASAVDVLDVTFWRESTTRPETKPEGVTAFLGTDARRLLIVDDNGGFAVFDSV